MIDDIRVCDQLYGNQIESINQLCYVYGEEKTSKSQLTIPQCAIKSDGIVCAIIVKGIYIP